MQTLDAPLRMTSREQARALVHDVGDVAGATVVVAVQADARVTASFIDQVIVSLLVEKGADAIVFRGMTDLARDLATFSATTLAVEDRISFRASN